MLQNQIAARMMIAQQRNGGLIVLGTGAPIIQVALDFPTLDEALKVAEIAVKAGVDWIEAGTVLINAQGYGTIGKLAQAFPGYPVLADFKTMDGGGRNVQITHEQGGKLMTVCGNAPDETIRAATKASQATGVSVVIDTIGVKTQVVRIKECVEWGAHAIYLHYGHDQHNNDPTRDSTQWIAEVKAQVNIPIGVGCFGISDAVRAVGLGAEIIAVGHPVISSKDPYTELKRFVTEVKEA